MMSLDDYVGRCRAFVIGHSEALSADDVGWAMHLIDHDEPAEGLCSLAWALEAAGVALTADEVDEFLWLVGDLVPADALPESVLRRGKLE
jgi:hypothetical protein